MTTEREALAAIAATRRAQQADLDARVLSALLVVGEGDARAVHEAMPLATRPSLSIVRSRLRSITDRGWAMVRRGAVGGQRPSSFYKPRRAEC